MNGLRVFRQFSQYAYFGGYFLKSLVGAKQPVLGGLKLTYACNLACVHCPFRKKKGAALSFEQAVACMQTLYDWGVRILIIEGGEPFLWRDRGHDLRDVVWEAKKLFFSVGVTTNGTFPLEVAADILWVSIDGLRATHNRLRSVSFDAVMANIAASAHPRIYAHITINSLNWREISDLVKFLAPLVKGVTIQFHYPYERAAADDELFLPFDARRKVLDTLIALKQQGFPVADSYACLKALQANRWKCQPWMIASVNPDGSMTRGCYVQNRGNISCEHCGFAVHTEISLAYHGVIGAILTGRKIFERSE